MAQVVKYFRQAEYERATKLGEKTLAKVSEEKKPLLLAVLGASHVRSGGWKRGRMLLEKVLDEHCSAMGTVFDAPEKLRVFAAVELAAQAAPKGEQEIIRGISGKCGRDFRTDYALARNGEGKTVGKAKLREVLDFYEAQSLVAAGRPEEARPLLASLEHAKGNMVLGGKAFSMPEVVAMLRRCLPAAANP